MATKLTTKTIFGVPSLETATRVDNSDKVSAFQAAHYRLSARMRQLECEFEAKASELRAAFVAEVAGIGGVGELSHHDAVIVFGLMIVSSAAVMAALGWHELAGFVCSVIVALVASAIATAAKSFTATTECGAWPAPQLFRAATRILYQAEVEPWHFCLPSIDVGQSELLHDQIGFALKTNSSRKRDGCLACPSEEKKITGRKNHENCLSRHGEKNETICNILFSNYLFQRGTSSGSTNTGWKLCYSYSCPWFVSRGPE